MPPSDQQITALAERLAAAERAEGHAESAATWQGVAKRSRYHDRVPDGTVIGTWRVCGKTKHRSGARYMVECVKCGKSRTLSRGEFATRTCVQCDGYAKRKPGADIARQVERNAELDAAGLPDLIWWADRRDPELDAALTDLIASRDQMTLDEVGMCFGLSRERIRQIEADALRKLRARCAVLGLTEEDARDVGGRHEYAHDDHTIGLSNHTHMRGYTASVRELSAAPPADCEPGEPMAAACLAELDRLEERMRAAVSVLDHAAEIAMPEAAE